MSFGYAANLRGQLSRAQFAEWAVTTDSMARGGGTCIDGSDNDVVVAAITVAGYHPPQSRNPKRRGSQSTISGKIRHKATARSCNATKGIIPR